MISVGIDVSKQKSSICILKEYDEVLMAPKEISHLKQDLDQLVSTLVSYQDEVRVVLESTGIYHRVVVQHLKLNGIFVAVLNPMIMKKYINRTIRKAKTDKIDAIQIANYGLDHWYRLVDYEFTDEIYNELRTLTHQYYQYIDMRIKGKVNLSNLLEQSMPGITKIIKDHTGFQYAGKLTAFAHDF